MNAQWLIYKAGGKPKEHELEQIDTHCAVCGVEISEGVPLKKLVSGNFTNWDRFKGTHACVACAHLLKGELATRLRRSSFVATEKEIKFFKNTELSQYLFNPPDPPFVFCYTTSFKKHNAFKARMSGSKEHFYVNWEDREVEVWFEEARRVFKALVKLYYAGFSRTELETGQYSMKKAIDFGIKQFLQLDGILSPHRGTLLFQLLLEALPAKRRDNYKKALRRWKGERSRGKGFKDSVRPVEELRLF